MAEAYAVTWPAKDGLDIRTVSQTRRAAIVNWLILVARVWVANDWTDEEIEKVWDIARGKFAFCIKVKLTEVPGGDVTVRP